MCIIIWSPNGKIPKAHLKESLRANRDGWGFAVACPEGGLHVAKGMERGAFWAAWKRRPAGAVAFHARIASHGAVTEAQCHPFEIEGHPELLLFHNGMIHDVAAHETLSDTQVFAQTVLSGLPANFLACAAIKKLIAGFVGRSKLVFLDGAGHVTIINEDLGHWFEGRWYSNRSYEPLPVGFTGKGVGPAVNMPTRPRSCVSDAVGFDLKPCDNPQDTHRVWDEDKLPEYYKNLRIRYNR